MTKKIDQEVQGWQQNWSWEKSQDVTKAMQSAGRNPLKRAAVGARAALHNKIASIIQGMYPGSDRQGTTKLSMLLRLFGNQKSAMWIDRFFGSAKERKGKAPTEQKQDGSSGPEVENLKVAIAQNTAVLKGVSARLDVLGDIVNTISEDVVDIKSLLMPKNIVAKGAAGTHAADQLKFVQFNPLAPQGENYREVTESGKLTNRKPGKDYMASAVQKAALESAKLALKIKEKDDQKAELRKKYGFKDVKEKIKEESPLEKIEERLENIEKKLEEKKKGGFLDKIMGMFVLFRDKIFAFFKPMWNIFKGLGKAVAAVAKWAVKFGGFVINIMWKAISGIPAAIRAIAGTFVKVLNFLKIPVPAFLAGAAAIGTTAAIGAAIDAGMKRGADEAIDGVLTDVTKKIENAPFEYTEDQKYSLYKMEMDKSMESEDAKRPDRAEYRKQQWTQSEGLSDEEKAMARRYFYEREGGAKASAGQKNARGRPQPIPVATETPVTETPVVEEPATTPMEEVVTPAAPMEEVVVTASAEPVELLGTRRQATRRRPYYTPDQKPQPKISKPEVPEGYGETPAPAVAPVAAPVAKAPTKTDGVEGELRRSESGDYERRLAQLAEVVASGESKGDYNIYNKGTVGKNAGKIGRTDFSKMTVSEYLRRGSLGKDDPDKIFAMGKYQIIPDTMRGIVKGMNLNPDTTYLTPETQDKMFKYIIERKPAVKNYLLGKSTDQNAAILALAKEWASIGVPEDTMRGDTLIRKGSSYYSGQGGNKAHTSVESVASALGSPTPTSDSETMLASVKSAPTIQGTKVDGESRALVAATRTSTSATPVVINAPSNNTVSAPPQGVKTPLPKASPTSSDDAWVRVANRDTKHPIYG